MMKISPVFAQVNRLAYQKRQLSYKRLITWYSGLIESKPVGPPHKHVIQIGDPRLRAISQPVPYEEIETEKIQKLIKHLGVIFEKYSCVGLSAPQVGISLRIFIMGLNKKSLDEFSPKEREIKGVTLVGRTVVINPKIEIVDYKKIFFEESCGSIRGFYADVPRYHSVCLEGLNEYAEPIKINASGYTARIIQHEMDHLNGKLYTDIMDRKTLSCGCWEVVNQRNGKVQLPYGPY